MLHITQQWYEKASEHREELKKIHVSISLKRRKHSERSERSKTDSNFNSTYNCNVISGKKEATRFNKYVIPY